MKQATSESIGFLASLAENFKLLIGQMSFGLMGNPKAQDTDVENVTNGGPILNENEQLQKEYGERLKTVREWLDFISPDSIRRSCHSDKPPVNS